MGVGWYTLARDGEAARPAYVPARTRAMKSLRSKTGSGLNALAAGSVSRVVDVRLVAVRIVIALIIGIVITNPSG